MIRLMKLFDTRLNFWCRPKYARGEGDCRVRSVPSRVFLVFLALLLFVSGMGAVGNRAFADESDSVIVEIGQIVGQKAAAFVSNTDESGANDVLESPSAIEEIGKVVWLKVSGPQIAELLPTKDYASHVGELLQNDIMIAGCELVSLGIALDSMGVETDLEAIVNDYLNMDGSFATGYAGDPYWEGGGFPPGIAAAANGYLEASGSKLRAYDITGATFDNVAEYVKHGYPVLVWSTMWFDDPDLTGVFEDDAEWYSNEHCVVLYGFSDDGEIAFVSDPLEGRIERETARFSEIYEQCGCRAVALY